MEAQRDDGKDSTFRCPRCDEVKPRVGAILVKWDADIDMLTCEPCAPKFAEERRAVMARKRTPRRKHSFSGHVRCPLCSPLRCSKAK